MTTDNSKRDIWEEVKQERKEKEEREWRNRHSVKQLKEDYPDLIPPSRYDKIFISQIGEMEFIVDDEDKENYFEIYDLEPDPYTPPNLYDEYYKNKIGIVKQLDRDHDEYRNEYDIQVEIGIKKIHTVRFSNDPDLHIRLWGEILERVRNNENWIKFSQENQDWLERQDRLFTPVEEEHKRKVDEEWKKRNLNREFEIELHRRRGNGDRSVLKYDSLETEYVDRIDGRRTRRTFDYDGSSFEKELEKRINYFTEVIRQDNEYIEENHLKLFDEIYLEEE